MKSSRWEGEIGRRWFVKGFFRQIAGSVVGRKGGISKAREKGRRYRAEGCLKRGGKARLRRLKGRRALDKSAGKEEDGTSLLKRGREDQPAIRVYWQGRSKGGKSK